MSFPRYFDRGARSGRRAFHIAMLLIGGCACPSAHAHADEIADYAAIYDLTVVTVAALQRSDPPLSRKVSFTELWHHRATIAADLRKQAQSALATAQGDGSCAATDQARLLKTFIEAFDGGEFDHARDVLIPLAAVHCGSGELRMDALRLRIGIALIQGHLAEADAALAAAKAAAPTLPTLTTHWWLAMLNAEIGYERFYASHTQGEIVRSMREYQTARYTAEYMGRWDLAELAQRGLDKAKADQKLGHPDAPLGGATGFP